MPPCKKSFRALFGRESEAEIAVKQRINVFCRPPWRNDQTGVDRSVENAPSPLEKARMLALAQVVHQSCPEISRSAAIPIITRQTAMAITILRGMAESRKQKSPRSELGELEFDTGGRDSATTTASILTRFGKVNKPSRKII